MSDFSNKHNIWDIFIVHYMKIRVHYNQKLSRYFVVLV